MSFHNSKLFKFLAPLNAKALPKTLSVSRVASPKSKPSYLQAKS